MPIMQVYMVEGRSLEQKRTLVANLTDAVVKSLGVKPETVRIHLFEKKKEDMSVGGTLFLDLEK